MSGGVGGSIRVWRAGAGRAAGFLAFWLALYGGALSGFPVGLATAAAATWISLRLVPPTGGRLALRPFARFVFRFVAQSGVAGIDVARRAFDPKMPLRPGFVTVPLRLAPGNGQSAFRTVMSLLPGSMPCGGEADDAMEVHCLDLTAPVAAQLREEEALFIRAFGLRGHD